MNTVACKNRVMLDFETFGNSKNACVIQIGAAYFDLEGTITRIFKCNVDARNAVKNGALIDADTVYWWLRQSPEAIQSVAAQDNLLVEYAAFADLNNFLANADEIWSHATFDFVILTETLRRLGLKPSFDFRVARDIRTLQSLTPSIDARPTREGTHHDALDDCKFQIAYCVPALRHILGGK